MKNHQAPTPRIIGDGLKLLVHSTFPTIQGEGPFAGTPAFFIRLAGCNLQCPLCDTEYTEGAEWREVGDLVACAVESDLPLVVITGGEPFRQNLESLTADLLLNGLKVQFETNGKLPPQNEDWTGWSLRNVTFVVSPKTARLAPWFRSRLPHAFKYVIKAGDVAEDGLPISALDHPLPAGATIARPPEFYPGQIYVQPADEHDEARNEANLQAAIHSVKMYPYQRKLCLQMHKYARLP